MLCLPECAPRTSHADMKGHILASVPHALAFAMLTLFCRDHFVPASTALCAQACFSFFVIANFAMSGRSKKDAGSWISKKHWTQWNAERFDEKRSGLDSTDDDKAREKHHEILRDIQARGNTGTANQADVSAADVRSSSLAIYRLEEMNPVDFAPRRHTYMVNGRPCQARCHVTMYRFDVWAFLVFVCECATRPRIHSFVSRSRMLP